MLHRRRIHSAYEYRHLDTGIQRLSGRTVSIKAYGRWEALPWVGGKRVSKTFTFEGADIVGTTTGSFKLMVAGKEVVAHPLYAGYYHPKGQTRSDGFVSWVFDIP